MNSESHNAGSTDVAVRIEALRGAVSAIARREGAPLSVRETNIQRSVVHADTADIGSSTFAGDFTSEFADDDHTCDLPPPADDDSSAAKPMSIVAADTGAQPTAHAEARSASPAASESLPVISHAIAAAEGVLLRERYLLGRVVGTGGNGVVYQARDLRREKSGSNSHDIAIKVLRDEFGSDRRALARLKREFAHAQELSHPNIVRVYDIDCQNELWFITMELLDGRTLADVLRDPALSQDRHIVTASIAACATAMEYAHSRGILHCDFKPSNIFLTRDGEVKLLDFGAACEYGPQAAQTRSTRSATLAYASPQVLRCERPDPRDDIFSLACVSYEWLTGKHPFERRSSAYAMASGMQLNKLPGLTLQQYAALKQALSWEREQRPETVADFCRSLGITDGEPEAGRLHFPQWLKSVDRNATARIAATAALLGVTLLTVLALPDRQTNFSKQSARTAAVAPVHHVNTALIASARADVNNAGIHPPVYEFPLHGSGHDLGDSLRNASTQMFGTDGELSAIQPVAWRSTAVPPVSHDAPPAASVAADKPAARVPPQIVALKDVSITVSSRASMAVVPLIRRNGDTGVLRVKWHTLAGSAKPDVDYRTVTAGSVNFLDNQAHQVLYVPLVGGEGRRGNRSFNVELQGVAGGARLDDAMTAHITIRDDG